jgi:hypothetical protein
VFSLENKPHKVAVRSDFAQCSLWRRDEHDDLVYPVVSEKDIPENDRDLLIRAKFTTPSGDAFDGYIVGFSRVFAISIFVGDLKFGLNKNAYTLVRATVQKILDAAQPPFTQTVEDFFPLKYQTAIDRQGFREFTGTFDVEPPN